MFTSQSPDLEVTDGPHTVSRSLPNMPPSMKVLTQRPELVKIVLRTVVQYVLGNLNDNGYQAVEKSTFEWSELNTAVLRITMATELPFMP